MTITEMHLNIDLELNKLNSNLYDIILPQEKDYFLNRAQERFIKQRYSPKSNNKKEGFEMSQKRIDDLKNLLVPNYYDKTFKLAAGDFDILTKSKFYFPDDYMFLTSSRSKVTYNPCGSITPVEETINYNVGVLTLAEQPNYDNLSIWIDGATPINVGSPGQDPDLLGLTYLEKSLILQYCIEKLNERVNGWKFYSSFKGIVGDIVCVKTVGAGDVGITYTDGAPEPETTTSVRSYVYFTASGTQNVIPNRFAQQDDVYIMQQDPFNKTSYIDGPLTIIHTNSIDVFFEPNNFIVNEIAISYLRKPKLMSLTINQSCELDEETHAEIVRDCVNLLLENFEADKRLSTSLGVEATNE